MTVSIVYVKNKKNQTTYVYESTAYWDKEKQQSRNTRVCIGKLVDNVFVPNKQYRMQQELEQLRQERPELQDAIEFTRLFYGATYLLQQIGNRYGITEDLQRCFPDSYRQMLSLAYFLILEENNTISRFPKWASTHALPAMEAIPPQRCSELFQSVTADLKEQFFRLQVARRKEQEYLSFDISSVASFVETFIQIKYRESSGNDSLSKINLTLLYGEESKMPVSYRKLPSYVAEVSTLKRILKDLSPLIEGKIKFILDRDFYSEHTVNELYTNHYKFLMGTRVSLPFIQSHLDPVRETIKKRSHYHSGYKLGCYSLMSVWPHERVKKRNGDVIRTEKRIYVHLYYSEQLDMDDRIAFNKRLELLEDELYANKRVRSHEEQYETYFDLRQSSGRKLSITLKQEAIDAEQKNFGYFSLISNDFKDPIEALEVYRSRALIEDAFGNLKERLNMKGTLASYEQNLEGKLFVQFIAHMFVAAIDKTMKEKDLYRSYSMTDLLDTLDVLVQSQVPGKQPYVEEITEEQRALYAHFGIEVPE